MTSKTKTAKQLPRLGAAVREIAPGLLLSSAAVAVSLAVALVVPAVSALLIAIVLGAVARNTARLPASVEPGLAFASRRLLRLGVVLLGLRLVLGDILGLGAGMILLVVLVVAIGITATLAIGRAMGVGPAQRLLIACGFSICGAAAVAAVDGVIEAEEEEVVTAVALVVLFGTLMIPLVPLVVGLLGLSDEAGGLWAGASVHEVAQAVAAGGALGGTALSLAVIVKLARVLMLAPVMAAVSLIHRRTRGAGGKRPPVVPLFVAGFVAMVLLRSTGVVPDEVLRAGEAAQTALLSAAMFALGAGVHLKRIVRVGPKPFLLALVSTVIVAGVALGGVLLVA